MCLYLFSEVSSSSLHKYAINTEMTMEDNTNIKQRPSREGQNNPMYGRKHTEEARRKQSEATKNRYKEYQKWKDSQHHITMDEFLNNKPIKEYISKVIKEEIDRIIRNRIPRKV